MASLSERLARTAAAGVAVWTLAGCGVPEGPVSTPTRPAVLGPAAPGFTPELTRPTEIVPKPDNGKEYVISAIRELPPSAIKDLLVSRVEPFLSPNKPMVIDIAGVAVRVYSFEVFIEQVPNTNIMGISNMRSDRAHNIPTIELAKDTTTFMPYVGLAKRDEMNKFSNISKDGTQYYIFENSKGARFSEGIWPHIQLNIPDANAFRNPADRAALPKLIKQMAVKEAATILFGLLQTEATIKEMRRSGIDPLVDVVFPDGSVGKAEAVLQSLNAFDSSYGRYTATSDIGGEVLAVWAADPQVLREIDLRNADQAALHSEILKLKPGNTPEEILKNAIQAVQTIPNIPHFYQGDLTKLP